MTWTRPDCVAIMRLLMDETYVLYKVDRPSEQVRLTFEELKKVSDLFSMVLKDSVKA
jgi:hypothetical protein